MTMAKPRMDLSTFVGKLLEEQDGDVLREGVRVPPGLPLRRCRVPGRSRPQLEGIEESLVGITPGRTDRDS